MIKKLVVSMAAGAFVLALGTSAEAIPVSFTTDGSFTAGAGCANVTAVSINCGGFTVTFAGTTENFPNIGFSNTNFGSFTTGGTTGGPVVNANATFTLNITQTLPVPNDSPFVFNGTLSGTFELTQSGASITFVGPYTRVVTGPTATVTYRLLENDGGIAGRMVLPNSPGNSSIEADISAVPIPEPGSMLLLGSGLLGLARAARRRQKNRAA